MKTPAQTLLEEYKQSLIDDFTEQYMDEYAQGEELQKALSELYHCHVTAQEDVYENKMYTLADYMTIDEYLSIKN